MADLSSSDRGTNIIHTFDNLKTLAQCTFLVVCMPALLYMQAKRFEDTLGIKEQA